LDFPYQYHSTMMLYAHMLSWDEQQARWWPLFRDTASPNQYGRDCHSVFLHASPLCGSSAVLDGDNFCRLYSINISQLTLPQHLFSVH
jgi:hypothetical protein